jgi:hypothetical protein
VGALAVGAGAVRVAAAVQGVGETGVAAGLLVAGADPVGEGECLLVVGPRGPGLAGRDRGVAEAVERRRLPVPVAGLAVAGQRLAMVFGGLLVPALPAQRLALVLGGLFRPALQAQREPEAARSR